MSVPAPRREDLPEAFPAFPLAGALLLPGGKLPLNIFEPRYLALTEDALANRRLLAMIQPDASRPESAAGPALFRIGCLGRLSSFSEADDGRYLITLSGLIRFTVAEELSMRRGYRRLRGDFSAFAADLAPPAPLGLNRAALTGALRGYFARHGINANWDAIAKMPDDDVVITLAMVCPFDPLEKQALLEAPTAAARAETLLTLLRIDSHAAPADDAAIPRPSPGRAS
jgi:Lon protease-like protein